MMMKDNDEDCVQLFLLCPHLLHTASFLSIRFVAMLLLLFLLLLLLLFSDRNCKLYRRLNV